MNHMYTLTRLTGRGSGDNRTIVVQGFEAKRRTWQTLSVSGVAGVVVGAIAWPFVGYLAVLPLMAVAAAVFIVLNKRSREGMQLRSYQSLRDRHRSEAGQFFMAGARINPFQADSGWLRSNTVPGPAALAAPREDQDSHELHEDQAPEADPVSAEVDFFEDDQLPEPAPPPRRPLEAAQPAAPAMRPRTPAHQRSDDPWSSAALPMTSGATSSW